MEAVGLRGAVFYGGVAVRRPGRPRGRRDPAAPGGYSRCWMRWMRESRSSPRPPRPLREWSRTFTGYMERRNSWPARIRRAFRAQDIRERPGQGHSDRAPGRGGGGSRAPQADRGARSRRDGCAGFGGSLSSRRERGRLQAVARHAPGARAHHLPQGGPSRGRRGPVRPTSSRRRRRSRPAGPCEIVLTQSSGVTVYWRARFTRRRSRRGTSADGRGAAVPASAPTWPSAWAARPRRPAARSRRSSRTAWAVARKPRDVEALLAGEVTTQG